MKRLVIIDIGSNSMRLVMVRIHHQGYFKLLYDVKESVRLEEGMTENDALSPARMDKAINTLKIFRQVSDSLQADKVVAVATEAVRRATNQAEFLERARREAGFEIRVLSGEEEAHFSYLGVVNSLPVTDGLMMDIGGGSTELALIQDRRQISGVSIPFGAINLTQQFELRDSMQQRKETELKRFLKQIYSQIPWLAEARPARLIGVGGAFRNLGKVDRRRRDYPLELSHNYRFKANDLQDLYQFLRNKNLDQRLEVKGLSDDRADIILGAGAAISELVDYCNIPEVVLSGYGLREGIVYNELSENGLLADVLDYSLANTLHNYAINDRHPRHVWNLARSLFEQLEPLHGLSAETLPILKTATILHDLGIAVRYYRHHEHSFYLILNSDINGISHRELVMSASIVAADDSGLDKSDIKFREILSKSDFDTMRKLNLLLRIAGSLDHTMSQTIEAVQCDLQKETVIIKTLRKKDADLDIFTALRTAPEFRKVFRRDLFIL